VCRKSVRLRMKEAIDELSRRRRRRSNTYSELTSPLATVHRQPLTYYTTVISAEKP